MLAAQATGLFAQFARAWAPVPVSGKFTFAGKLLTGCPTGSIVCSSGNFNGDLEGPFQFSIQTILPSASSGVEFYTGKLVLHAGTGDIDCDLNGATDTNTSSEGEFGEICVITGGTGAYVNATGDLRLIGTSTSTLMIPSGGGVYQGSIKVP